ncbi:MAG: ABC-ATPase domain-containing protein [Myxococcota bacterium]|nr:ABC-ATPase domain-containing protein [Myxococcota bacterium]
MSDPHPLTRELKRLDGRGYKAYSDLRGSHAFPAFTLFIDHIQGDPFAAPSRIRLRVPQEVAHQPEALTSNPTRRIAFADWLARRIRKAIGTKSVSRANDSSRPGRRGDRFSRRGGGSGKSGIVAIDAGGQEVLERTAIKITPDWVEARMEIGLPAAGRRILAQEAIELLTQRLPDIVERAIIWNPADQEEATHFVECIENQEAIRSQLGQAGLVAFVADGALLPRSTGASSTPMRTDQIVAFRSPESLAVSVQIPNPRPEDGRTELQGMGVRKGVTLIVGGGYHGKSTLLTALEHGVYPHIPGDGREYVVSSADLVKIRSEDGRSVRGVDIHAFIGALPSGQNDAESLDPFRTRSFSTDDASGSTSQAAAIAEAIEAGSDGLLLDEDTSATNFMLRAGRMQKLVHSENEPITPFVDRVREIYDDFDVSTILVMGGSGDYFDVADTVIMMKNYQASDVTAEARDIAKEMSNGRLSESRCALEAFAPRRPMAESIVASRGRKQVKISAKSRELILYGEEDIDLRHLTQIVDTSQTRAIAWAIHLASQHLMRPSSSSPQRPELTEVLDALESIVAEQGLDALGHSSRKAPLPDHPGRLARPRRHEVAGALNRLRSLKVEDLKRRD